MCRKLILVLAFILTANEAFCSESFVNFTLINKTGKTIHRIYLRPSDRFSWDLDNDEVSGIKLPLKSKKQIKIGAHNLRESGSYVYWDLRVYFKNGQFWNWHELDLKGITKIELMKNGEVVRYSARR